MILLSFPFSQVEMRFKKVPDFYNSTQTYQVLPFTRKRGRKGAGTLLVLRT
jgi:hypothetical protein